MHPGDAQPVPCHHADVFAARRRFVESCRDASVCASHRPPPGSVPFDAHLEDANRVGRTPDTFSLSGDASPRRARTTPTDATPAPSKSGWARLGDVLTPASWRRPPAPAQGAPDTRQAVVRHTGTGRMIDVIA
ncbi:MAG: hypothetical protein ACF8Q5_12265 [Phycisphaerales bacterium JB040]